MTATTDIDTAPSADTGAAAMRLADVLGARAVSRKFASRTNAAHVQSLAEAATILRTVPDLLHRLDEARREAISLRDSLGAQRKTCRELTETLDKKQSAIENLEQRLRSRDHDLVEAEQEKQCVVRDLEDAASVVETLMDGRSVQRLPAAKFLDEASRIVGGTRNETHGAKERSFEATATLWNAYLQVAGQSAKVTPADVALMLMLLKVSRMHSGKPIRDHFYDMAGYAGIAGELALDA